MKTHKKLKFIFYVKIATPKKNAKGRASGKLTQKFCRE
jgi:hypothetical protein